MFRHGDGGLIYPGTAFVTAPAWAELAPEIDLAATMQPVPRIGRVAVVDGGAA
ncbi:MAG: hypothetical protein P3W94_007250 [Paracoccus sp. (in: a-proteobacteria)]|nr:hypothetical protein [Paracoccus sp. (in: a-proteobacteria)]